MTEFQIYQNFTKRPVLQNFSTKIIQRPRQNLQTSWSIFVNANIANNTSACLNIPHRGKVIKIANPCSLFHTFSYLLSSPQSLAANCIWSNFYGKLKYAQYSSKFIFPSPIEWETELTKWKIWLYFYSVNILVSVTNMWGWWKEKCLSRLKPWSIWTLRLHTSFCGSVERAKIIFSEPKLRLSNWLESPCVLRPSDQSPPMSISLRLEYSSRPCLTNHDL